MTDQAPPIDPILEARLDLLEQVLDEVQDIRTAVNDQQQRLEAVERFLKADGELSKLRAQLAVGISDADRRLQFAQAQDDELILDARARLAELQPYVDEDLEESRQDAYQRFLGLKQWSVAKLDRDRLEAAERLYRTSLREIRNSPEPWAKYEEQLRSRGAQLFKSYLELLGSIAVRGFGAEDDLADTRKAMLELLLSPLGSRPEVPRLLVPNLLTRTAHLQLGYFRWNLWGLPLIGREAGLHLIQKDIFSMSVPAKYDVICADGYATVTLGPSYVAATLFLELDPDGRPDGDKPSDPVRAELLLELVPSLAAGPQRRPLSDYTDKLRAAWQAARGGVGAADLEVSSEVRDTQRKFIDGVSRQFPEIGYDMSNLGNRASEATAFVNESSVAGTGTPWDLLVSMWWARVHHPDAHQIIDQQARLTISTGPPAHGPPTPRVGTLTGRTRS